MRRDVDFFGTLPPARRASASPIAMACLRLDTFFPELERSVPRFRSCMAFFTSDFASVPYLRLERVRVVMAVLFNERLNREAGRSAGEYQSTTTAHIPCRLSHVDRCHSCCLLSDCRRRSIGRATFRTWRAHAAKGFAL